jgi:hypothetical protein
MVMVDAPPVAAPKLTDGCFASSSDCVPVVSTTVTVCAFKRWISPGVTATIALKNKISFSFFNIFTSENAIVLSLKTRHVHAEYPFA